MNSLQAVRKTGRAILAAGSSTGIVAKSAEAGGADLIVVYSTGLSRMWGLPTTGIGHSNIITPQMLPELLNVVDNTPIIGGADATDPTYRRLDVLLDEFMAAGFNGIINFPTIGDRPLFSSQRTHVGQGWDREAELIRRAHDRGIFTMAYVYTPEQARMTAAAGVDVQVAHVGWTVGGVQGAGQLAMDLVNGCVTVREIVAATLAEKPGTICLGHGGPFATHNEVAYLYEHTDVDGFVGASSIERIPIEAAVTSAVRDYKCQQVRGRN